MFWMAKVVVQPAPSAMWGMLENSPAPPAGAIVNTAGGPPLPRVTTAKTRIRDESGGYCCR